MRRIIQWILARFGYRIVRASVTRARMGFASPPDAEVSEPWRLRLDASNPRLAELRRRYAAVSAPMAMHTWWTKEYVSKGIDLTHFRGDNAYVWQTRHMGQDAALRYFLYARDVAARDNLQLFSRLSEDGAFGCWVFHSRQFPALSRDLLDSVNEINFLDRHAHISDISRLHVLDIGAGYGRLAHRCESVLPNLAAYVCIDAVAESTFVCEAYLEYRGCADGKVVPLDKADSLAEYRFDLAINVHSFSEMSLAAIEGWLDVLERLRVPRLFVVPNDSGDFLTMEADGSRRPYRPAIEQRGFRLAASEAAVADDDVRDLIGVHDWLYLFVRSDA